MCWLIFLMSSFFASENNINECNHEFLKSETLKTWVAQKFQNENVLAFFKKMLYLQLSCNPNCIDYNAKPIDPEPHNPFPGRTLYIFCDIYLPYLQEAYRKGLEKRLSIIEIGVARGFKFWPLSYALTNGGDFYANDLSTTVEADFDQKIEECFLKSDDITIKKLFGVNCLSLFQDPSLKGKMDFLLSENVCHMFNPSDHQKFLELINYLLQPGGQAFVVGETLTCKKADRSDQVFLAYINAKNAGAIYPGFLKTKMKAVYEGKLGGRLAYEIISSKTPSDFTVQCSHFHSGASREVMFDGQGITCCLSIDTVNHMTPRVFRDAVNNANETKGTTLLVKDAYFLDYSGKRCETFQANNVTGRAAAIIQKKP